MKLTDLNPMWFDIEASSRRGVAVEFDCPCGRKEPECSRLWIPFLNPTDGGPAPRPESAGWQRTGDTFETLNLTPSIRRMLGCQWHGWVENGVIKHAQDWLDQLSQKT